MKNSTFNGKINLIGKQLKKYRKIKKLSQEQLCIKLSLMGITLYKNDIYRIENNKRAVKDFELLGISKALDINIYDLLNDKNLNC